MNNKSIQRLKKRSKKSIIDSRVNIKISEELLTHIKEAITELNLFYEKFEKNEAKKGTQKVENLTIKSFTEGSILYAIKHKIDPRFFQDDSVFGAINKLRNHLLGFIVMQENKLIRPFQQDIIYLKEEVHTLKKALGLEKNTIEETALETQATLMGLVYVLFEMFDISDIEKKKLEQLLQNKGIEFIKKIQK